MSLSHVRFTILRLMVTVAIVAVLVPVIGATAACGLTGAFMLVLSIDFEAKATRPPAVTLRRFLIASGVVILLGVTVEVIRYQGMVEVERNQYLFVLNSAFACGSIPAIALGVLVFLFFLSAPDSNRKR